MLSPFIRLFQFITMYYHNKTIMAEAEPNVVVVPDEEEDEKYAGHWNINEVNKYGCDIDKSLMISGNSSMRIEMMCLQ